MTQTLHQSAPLILFGATLRQRLATAKQTAILITLMLAVQVWTYSLLPFNFDLQIIGQDGNIMNSHLLNKLSSNQAPSFQMYFIHKNMVNNTFIAFKTI